MPDVEIGQIWKFISRTSHEDDMYFFRTGDLIYIMADLKHEIDLCYIGVKVVTPATLDHCYMVTTRPYIQRNAIKLDDEDLMVLKLTYFS
jgi:hypothetical protein